MLHCHDWPMQIEDMHPDHVTTVRTAMESSAPGTSYISWLQASVKLAGVVWFAAHQARGATLLPADDAYRHAQAHHLALAADLARARRHARGRRVNWRQTGE